MKDPTDTKTKELPLDDPYIVYYNGEPRLKLSKHLIETQNLSESDVERIKSLHQQRLHIEEDMNKVYVKSSQKLLKDLFKRWTAVEYLLQDAWGFEQNSMYHKFWEVPGCDCPVLDNEDAYPYRQWINCNCLIHGETV